MAAISAFFDCFVDRELESKLSGRGFVIRLWFRGFGGLNSGFRFGAVSTGDGSAAGFDARMIMLIAGFENLDNSRPKILNRFNEV